MKKLLVACVLALPLLALSDQKASAWGNGSGHFSIGLNLHVSWGRWCDAACCDSGCGYGYDGLSYGGSYDDGSCLAGQPVSAPSQPAAPAPKVQQANYWFGQPSYNPGYYAPYGYTYGYGYGQ